MKKYILFIFTVYLIVYLGYIVGYIFNDNTHLKFGCQPHSFNDGHFCTSVHMATTMIIGIMVICTLAYAAISIEEKFNPKKK